MKTVTYPLRLTDEVFERVRHEAKRRQKKLSEAFRKIIAYGLDALLPAPQSYEAAQAAWDSLGPAPQVIYEKLPQSTNPGGVTCL